MLESSKGPLIKVEEKHVESLVVWVNSMCTNCRCNPIIQATKMGTFVCYSKSNWPRIVPYIKIDNTLYCSPSLV